MNKFVAVGRLINTGLGDYGYSEARIIVKRKKPEDAFLRVTLETTLDPSIQYDDVVRVEGYVRGYSFKDTDDKWKIHQYLVATKVEHATGDMMEVFGVKDHFAPPNYIKIFLSGKVTSVSDLGHEWKGINISIDGDKEEPDVASFTLHDNVRLDEYREILKGDEIVVSLTLRTPPPKIIDGKKIYHNNLISNDIYITSREILHLTKEERRARGITYNKN